MTARLDLSLEADLGAAASARRAVMNDVPELFGRARDDALLVVSELVTNAVLHGSGEVRCRVDVDDGRLRVEVSDDNEAMGTFTAESRGITLITALAVSFGMEVHDHGKTIWAELSLHRDEL